MKKLVSIVLAVAMVLVVLAAGSAFAQEEAPKVALSNSYAGNNWRSGMLSVFESYAKKLVAQGVISEFYATSAGNDAQAQINEIRNLISEGYDIILVDAASPTALVSVCEEAVERGIIVVSFDNIVESDLVYRVCTDRKQYGILQAEWMAEQLGGAGNVIVVTGIESSQATIDALIGIRSVLDKYPDIKVIAQAEGQWDNATAASVLNDILAANQGVKIDGIFCEGGDVGILETLRQWKVDLSQIRIACEMENGVFKAMLEENLKAICVGSPMYAVCASLDVAVRVVNGEEVPVETYIDLPSGDYTKAAEWYMEGFADDFFVSWKDNNNSYGLSMEEVFG